MSAKVGKDMLLHRLTILGILREQTKLRWRFAISTHHPRGHRHYIQGSIARDKSASAMSHDIQLRVNAKRLCTYGHRFSYAKLLGCGHGTN